MVQSSLAISFAFCPVDNASSPHLVKHGMARAAYEPANVSGIATAVDRPVSIEIITLETGGE
ncbi:hypothetical protein CHS0354_033061 [Potamilus streckersoni]|uniref:Uncharacterized protein n=1 Tax=Potamilus streckersoni TaxID=2493646 RepID=A0AAE0SQA3_9BIVA|nr:hypothetical protein CHS0354_033061 [Potamilus streckersoni]